MSTWISDPRRLGPALLPGLGAVLLSGCMAGGPQATAGGFSFVRAAPQKVTVAGDTVVIAGPRGFCVDGKATRDGEEGAFVLMASCAAVSGRRGAPVPQTEALLTASVAGQPGPGGSAEDRALVLSRYFSADEGRAALARDGRAASVEVDRMFDRDGVFFIHARDQSAGLGAGLRDDYWRAIFDVNGRIVTASVVGFAARPIADEAGLAMLGDFAARIRAESAALVPTVPDAVPVAETPPDALPAVADPAPVAASVPAGPAAPAPEQPRKRGLFGFLWR